MFRSCTMLLLQPTALTTRYAVRTFEERNCRTCFAVAHLESDHSPARLACGTNTAELAVPTATLSAPKVTDFDRSTDERSWIPYPPCTRARRTIPWKAGTLRRVVG